MTKDEIQKQREYIIAKSNRLTQKARFSMTADEQKLILFAISKIKPDDKMLDVYCFPVRDIIDVFGLTQDKTNYDYFCKKLKGIADKSFWFADDSKRILFRFFSYVSVDDKAKTVEIGFEPRLKPYLIALHDNFTEFKLENALVMKSKYSLKLYEILKSWAANRSWYVTVAEFRDIMLPTKEDGEKIYSRFNCFRQKIIEKSVDEINRLSDITVKVDYEKTGKTVTDLCFHIRRKKGYEEIQARFERLKILK